jgi:hypothetical protein
MKAAVCDLQVFNLGNNVVLEIQNFQFPGESTHLDKTKKRIGQDPGQGKEDEEQDRERTKGTDIGNTQSQGK